MKAIVYVWPCQGVSEREVMATTWWPCNTPLLDSHSLVINARSTGTPSLGWLVALRSGLRGHHSLGKRPLKFLGELGKVDASSRLRRD